MTCTVNREKLAAAMSAAVKVCGGKDMHHDWQGVRLQLTGGFLCVTATDGKMFLHLTVEASGELPAVVVPANLFRDVVLSLSGELIGLQLEGSSLRLFAGKGKRTLSTLPADDFPSPEFTASKTVTMDADTILAAIEFAGPHVADINDHAKAYAAGLFLFAESGRLKAIGTNGGEMALIDLAEEIDIAVAIPECVTALATDLLHGDVEIGIGERAAEFRWAGGVLRGPLLENAIATEALLGAVKKNLSLLEEGSEPFTVEIEAKALLERLRGVRGLGNVDTGSRGRMVKLTLNGVATLSTTSHEGSAEEEVPADLTGAREFEIGFSSARMERVLRGFGDRVLTVTFRDSVSPMKFEAAGLPDRVKLLFPMRV